MFQKLGLVFLCVIMGILGANESLKGQSVLYGLTSLAQKYENDSLCYRQIGLLYEAIESNQVWGLKAQDASGTPGPGFLYGNNLWLGAHAQCLDISNTRRFEVNYEKVKHAEATPHDYPPYPMQFFMAYMLHNNTLQSHSQLPLEFTVQLGVCMPKSCSPEDLTRLFSDYLKMEYLNIQNLYDLNLTLLDIKPLLTSWTWLLKLPKTIILGIIIAILIVLTTIGTIYDVKQHHRLKNLIVGHKGTMNGKPNSESVVVLVPTFSDEPSCSTLEQVLKCFSLYSNFKNLVKTSLPPDSVPVIHGLRFFGMLWVILVHAVFYQADYLENAAIAYRLSEDLFAQILSNSTYCVDTYLFISGFLVGYLFFKSKKGKSSDEVINYLKKVSEFFMMCANRLLRLTPPYLVTILLTDVVFTYYRNTSALTSSERNDVLCSQYWWRNILYINNLFPRREMCMSWSWYLSLDTQFFTITTLLLVLSTISFTTSAVLTIFLLLGNVMYTTYKSYSIGYIPTMDEQLAQLDAIYDLPWNRMGPYLIGVITAYVLLVKLQKELIIKERTRILLWIFFPLLNLWILFTLYTRQISVEFSAVYMGCSRTLWGIGLGWMLIACCTGNARALEKFLSFKGWIPLSRLTYCAYLVNPLVATMLYLGSERSYNASIASFALSSQGVAMNTFLVSLVFSVLFESPFILLTKLVFNKMKRVNPKSINEPA